MKTAQGKQVLVPRQNEISLTANSEFQDHVVLRIATDVDSVNNRDLFGDCSQIRYKIPSNFSRNVTVKFSPSENGSDLA